MENKETGIFKLSKQVIGTGLRTSILGVRNSMKAAEAATELLARGAYSMNKESAFEDKQEEQDFKDWLEK